MYLHAYFHFLFSEVQMIVLANIATMSAERPVSTPLSYPANKLIVICVVLSLALFLLRFVIHVAIATLLNWLLDLYSHTVALKLSLCPLSSMYHVENQCLLTIYTYTCTCTWTWSDIHFVPALYMYGVVPWAKNTCMYFVAEHVWAVPEELLCSLSRPHQHQATQGKLHVHVVLASTHKGSLYTSQVAICYCILQFGY